MNLRETGVFLVKKTGVVVGCAMAAFSIANGLTTLARADAELCRIGNVCQDTIEKGGSCSAQEQKALLHLDNTAGGLVTAAGMFFASTTLIAVSKRSRSQPRPG